MTEVSNTEENEFVKNVTSLLRSKATIITCESGEWKRVQGGLLDSIDAEVKHNAAQKRYLLKYNQVTELSLWNEEYDYWDNEHELIKRFASGKPWHHIIQHLSNEIDIPFVLWFDDFHPKFNLDGSPEHIKLIEHVRQFARVADNNNPNIDHNFSDRKTVVFTGENIEYIEEFQHESTKVEMPLPTFNTLQRAMHHVVSEYAIPSDKFDDGKQFVEAALGLSVDQALKAYRMAFVQQGDLVSKESRDLIIQNKKQIISQSGCLEYLEPKINIKDLGGLELLKDWLDKRKKAYSEKAKKRGLKTPKGILLAGVPGCGKSLTAKAVAPHWGFPLIRFDVGAAFGSKIGQSEGNIRQALKVAEAASPCVLWIDEIEKALAGSGGSGDNDSGTTMRVFGTILTWLNEVEKPVFVVATANSIEKLPPELKRKGRWDEIFFVDLPDHQSRKDIFEIHLNKLEKAALNAVDLEKLASLTADFTGAEIEEVVKSAQLFAFDEDREVLTQADLEEEIKRLIPMAKSGTMGKQIAEMRIRASEIGQMASMGNRGGIKPRKRNGGFDARGV